MWGKGSANRVGGAKRIGGAGRVVGGDGVWAVLTGLMVLVEYRGARGVGGSGRAWQSVMALPSWLRLIALW